MKETERFVVRIEERAFAVYFYAQFEVMAGPSFDMDPGSQTCDEDANRVLRGDEGLQLIEALRAIPGIGYHVSNYQITARTRGTWENERVINLVQAAILQVYPDVQFSREGVVSRALSAVRRPFRQRK